MTPPQKRFRVEVWGEDSRVFADLVSRRELRLMRRLLQAVGHPTPYHHDSWPYAMVMGERASVARHMQVSPRDAGGVG